MTRPTIIQNQQQFISNATEFFHTLFKPSRALAVVRLRSEPFLKNSHRGNSFASPNPMHRKFHTAFAIVVLMFMSESIHELVMKVKSKTSITYQHFTLKLIMGKQVIIRNPNMRHMMKL